MRVVFPAIEKYISHPILITSTKTEVTFGYFGLFVSYFRFSARLIRRLIRYPVHR